MQEAKSFEFEPIAEKNNLVLGWIDKRTLEDLQNPYVEENRLENFKWAMKISKLSDKTLRSILDKPFIRKQLDIENGGCVYYSDGHSHWKFIAPEFRKFVIDHPQYFIKGGI